jgi:hypothetical protein
VTVDNSHKDVKKRENKITKRVVLPNDISGGNNVRQEFVPGIGFESREVSVGS